MGWGGEWDVKGPYTRNLWPGFPKGTLGAGGWILCDPFKPRLSWCIMKDLARSSHNALEQMALGAPSAKLSLGRSPKKTGTLAPTVPQLRVLVLGRKLVTGITQDAEQKQRAWTLAMTHDSCQLRQQWPVQSPGSSRGQQGA